MGTKVDILNKGYRQAENIRDVLKSSGHESIILIFKDETMSYAYSASKERTIFLIEKLKKVILE